MNNAARSNLDKTIGGGILLNGSINVFINNIPASFLGSQVSPHGCCGEPGCEIHCSSVIITGSSTVFVNNIQSIRMGDSASCGDPIISGSPNVFFG